MSSYIELKLSDNDKSKLTQIAAIIGLLHDINSANNFLLANKSERIALTFSQEANFFELSSVNKVGLVGEPSKLKLLLQLDGVKTLFSNLELSVSEVQVFPAETKKAYFYSKDGIGVNGNLNQIKKRAKSKFLYLKSKGIESNPYLIEAEMLGKALELEKTTPHLKIKQYSNSAQKSITLTVVRSDELNNERDTRSVSVYGLNRSVPLLP